MSNYADLIKSLNGHADCMDIDAWTKCKDAADAIKALEADNAKMIEALKPFADIETLFCDSDEMEFELWTIVKSDMTIDRPTVKIGDLRRARAVSEKNNSKDMTKLEG